MAVQDPTLSNPDPQLGARSSAQSKTDHTGKASSQPPCYQILQPFSDLPWDTLSSVHQKGIEERRHGDEGDERTAEEAGAAKAVVVSCPIAIARGTTTAPCSARVQVLATRKKSGGANGDTTISVRVQDAPVTTASLSLRSLDSCAPGAYLWRETGERERVDTRLSRVCVREPTQGRETRSVSA